MIRPKILVADDDEGWRSLISLWLSEKGCELRLAGSGAEALAAALDFAPDCAILDYEMGDAKGTEVCATLRAQPALSELPVVILTQLAAQVIKTTQKEPGVHIVAKSQKPDELLAVLEGILRDRGWRRDWEEPRDAGPGPRAPL